MGRPGDRDAHYQGKAPKEETEINMESWLCTHEKSFFVMNNIDAGKTHGSTSIRTVDQRRHARTGRAARPGLVASGIGGLPRLRPRCRIRLVTGGAEDHLGLCG